MNFEFKSWNSYSDFAGHTKYRQRYIRDSDVDTFLETVLSTSKGREKAIPKETIFWRAQLGCDLEPIDVDGESITDLPRAFSFDRMKPSHRTAVEGRANPKGIPYLYVATQKNTALSEVRPWLGSLISLAQLKTLSDIVIIDCTAKNHEDSFYFEEPETEKKELAVWCDIYRAFSEPVTTNDRVADYVPTQILAELFKCKGFDGIAYRSRFGAKGFNLALFDLDTAEVINCSLYEAEDVSFRFEQAGNTHFSKEHYERRRGR
jgi:hypothetical protein